MRVLVACEESQEVCKAFRERGHEAFSSDMQPCSGGFPEWHLQGDVRQFPPCTRLANSGVHWLEKRKLWSEMYDGAQFFALFQLIPKIRPMTKVAIENPIPHKYAKLIIGDYSQLIQPWMFGHGEQKATCLWLYNLPRLKPTRIVDGREQRLHRLPPSPERAKLRSKTFPGIARAMAEQWG